MAIQIVDYQRIRLLRLLFSGYGGFREIYQAFKANGELPKCRPVEVLLETYFLPIRELSHRVLRHTEEEGDEDDCRDHELLLDLILGACYHEILQLQENLYLARLYSIRYDSLQSHVKDETLADFFAIGRRMIREAEKQIPANIDWIWELLQQALTLVRSIFIQRKFNRILLRYLIQHKPTLDHVYGQEAVLAMFESMFQGGYQEGLLQVIKDLSLAAHYRCSLDTLKELLNHATRKEKGLRVPRHEVRSILQHIMEFGTTIKDNEIVFKGSELQMALERIPG